MKNILAFAILILFAYSCNKNQTVSLMIRINNTTNVVFDSVQLTYDTTNYNYGSISENETTSYHSFKSLPSDPTANVLLNGNRIIAGRLFPPNSYPYPVLPNENYTLKIFADPTVPSGYNAEFIKE